MKTRRRFFRPTWAEIDLAALKANLRRFRVLMGSPTKLMFVVKGNAYGHGGASCALAAQKNRAADWLGVSSVEEGVVLREAGVKLPILILGSLYPFESFLAAVEYGLTPTVASLEAARRLSEAAKTLGRRVRCHVKVETGMGRIGVTPGAALEVFGFLAAHRSVVLEGVYTHFSCAETGRAFTKKQLALFKSSLSSLALTGLPRPIRHAANSAAALSYPASRLDMVRPGLALYGLYGDFKPVLTLKTKVVFIKNVKKGTPVSYGASYRCRRSSRIATLPIGYADGLSRGLSGRGAALVRGRRCPIVGKITMDMTMLDVTKVEGIRVGDDVVLIGSQGRETITAGDVARTLGTIPYEVTTAISSRVPRAVL